MTSPNTTPDLLVLKVGGSLVSDKSRADHLDQELVDRYAELVAELWAVAPGRVALVAGGGAIGHGAVRDLDPADPFAALGLTYATFRVKWAWVAALRKQGVRCFPLQVGAVCTLDDGLPRVAPRVSDELLAHEVLPVLSGDSVLREDGALQVFGSDRVPAVLLGTRHHRVRVVVLTDVPGVLGSDGVRSWTLPSIDPDAPESAVEHLWPAEPHDTSGAMAGKVETLAHHARCGAECFIMQGDPDMSTIRFLLRPESEWPDELPYTRIAREAALAGQ